MFRADPWAEAFIKLSGAFACEALEYVRLFCRSALALPGDLSGLSDANRIGASITAALEKTGTAVTGAESPELARRFVLLLIRKGCFHKYRAVTLAIQKRINKQKGLLEVIVEAAAEPDEGLLARIKEKAAAMTGAAEVSLVVRVIPELIGGLRLRMGSSLFDASIKTRLQKMTADLRTSRCLSLNAEDTDFAAGSTEA